MPRSVVVTGGMKGIGAAIARRLANDGWRVITTSHDPHAGAEILVDLAKHGAAERLFAEVREHLAGSFPDAIVNNAALLTGADELLELVNYIAPRRLTELMGERPPSAGCGTVVNILDAALLRGNTAWERDFVGYTRTKRALTEYTLSSAAEFSGRVRVNAVAVGAISLPKGVHLKATACPLGRPTTDDVAEAVAMLLKLEKTTGLIVPVDGYG